MRGKKKNALSVIRIIIDVLNVLAGIAVIALAVFTFISPKQRIDMFPYIFYLGAFINFITSIKHFISDRFWYGVVVFIFAIVLVAAGIFGQTVIGNIFI